MLWPVFPAGPGVPRVVLLKNTRQPHSAARLRPVTNSRHTTRYTRHKARDFCDSAPCCLCTHPPGTKMPLVEAVARDPMQPLCTVIEAKARDLHLFMFVHLFSFPAKPGSSPTGDTRGSGCGLLPGTSVYILCSTCSYVLQMYARRAPPQFHKDLRYPYPTLPGILV